MQRLLDLLRRFLRRRGRSVRHMERRLGLAEGRLSRVMSGRVRLKEGVLFAVLWEAAVAPEGFFRELDAEAGRRDPGPPDIPSRASLQAARDFLRQSVALREEDFAPPGEAAPPGTLARRRALEHCRQVRELLRQSIEAAGLQQQQVSRAMGARADYLNQVLRGNLDLRTEHVLAAVRALGLTPGAFYSELARRHPTGLEEGDLDDVLAAGVTWRQVLAIIDEALQAPDRRRGGGRGAGGRGRSGGAG